MILRVRVRIYNGLFRASYDHRVELFLDLRYFVFYLDIVKMKNDWK